MMNTIKSCAAIGAHSLPEAAKPVCLTRIILQFFLFLFPALILAQSERGIPDAGATVDTAASPAIPPLDCNEAPLPEEFKGATVTATGLFLGYQMNDHRMNFSTLPNVPTCCTEYTTGEGQGMVVAGHFQTPVSRWFDTWGEWKKYFGLQGRLGYAMLDGEMRSTQFIGNIVVNDSTVPANVEHYVEAGLGTLFIEPQIRYTPLNIPLSLNLGLHLGLLLRKNYVQQERLIDVPDATFVGEGQDGSDPRTRNNFNGDIEKTATFYFAGVGSLSYDIRISEKLLVAPEIGFLYGFTDILQDSLWKINSFRGGITVKYRWPDDPVREITLTPSTVMVRGVPVDSSGSTLAAMPSVRVTEYRASQVSPLLNMIFFDEGSAEIPRRYDQSAEPTFNLDQLQQMSAIQQYHQILQVVARRLQTNPQATLKVIAYKPIQGREMADATLADRRATAVRDYLNRVWKIPGRQLVVETRDVQAEINTSTDQSTAEDWRRVELQSDVQEVLAPVIREGTHQTILPDLFRVQMCAMLPKGVSHWRVVAMQDANPLFEKEDSNSVPGSVDFSFANERKTMNLTGETVDVLLDAWDTGDSVSSSLQHSVPIEYSRSEGTEVQRREYLVLPLMLEQPLLAEQSRAYINRIQSNLMPQATISISTDGSEKSLAAARTLASQLGVADRVKYISAVWQPDQTVVENRVYGSGIMIAIETPGN